MEPEVCEDAQSVVVRSAKGNLRESFSVPIHFRQGKRSVLIGDVVKKIHHEWGWEHLTLVHQGSVYKVSLADSGKIEEESFVDIEKCTVFVAVPLRPFSTLTQVSTDLVNDSASEKTEQELSPRELLSNEDSRLVEEKVDEIVDEMNRYCRICLMSSGEEGEGKLFSPCKCRGSMKFVHVGCLNAWRMRSSNAVSYFQCEQCLYKYDLKRTKLASVFEVLASNLSCIILSISTVVGAVLFASEIIEWSGMQGIFVEMFQGNSIQSFGIPKLDRYRRMNEASFNYYYCGFVLVGLLGAALHFSYYVKWIWQLHGHVNWVREFWENPNTILIGASIASHASNSVQVATGVGVVFFMYQIVLEAKLAFRNLFQLFGERLLEVKINEEANG